MDLKWTQHRPVCTASACAPAGMPGATRSCPAFLGRCHFFCERTLFPGSAPVIQWRGDDGKIAGTGHAEGLFSDQPAPARNSLFCGVKHRGRCDAFFKEQPESGHRIGAGRGMQDPGAGEQVGERVCCGGLPLCPGDLDHRVENLPVKQPPHCFMVGDDRFSCGTPREQRVGGVKVDRGHHEIVGCIHGPVRRVWCRSPVYVHGIYGVAGTGKSCADLAAAMDRIEEQDPHMPVR